MLKSVFCLHKGDVLILQYPLKKYYTFVCCMAHLRGCKIITLIHDLDSFRRRRLTIPHEISRLNHSDSIIVHSERMKNWLHENGIKANLEVLGVFDYLSDRQSSGKNLAASHPRGLLERYLLFIVIFYINWDVLHVRSIWYFMAMALNLISLRGK